MKKRIVILVVLINMCITFNAFAAVNFWETVLFVDEVGGNGWIVRTGFTYMSYNSASNTYRFTNVVPYDEVTQSRATVYKFDPCDELFNNWVWKRGNNGSVLGGEYWFCGFHQSYWNTTDYYPTNCNPKTYLTFQFQYLEGGAWTTFLFDVSSGCVPVV